MKNEQEVYSSQDNRINYPYLPSPVKAAAISVTAVFELLAASSGQPGNVDVRTIPAIPTSLPASTYVMPADNPWQNPPFPLANGEILTLSPQQKELSYEGLDNPGFHQYEGRMIWTDGYAGNKRLIPELPWAGVGAVYDEKSGRVLYVHKDETSTAEGSWAVVGYYNPEVWRGRVVYGANGQPIMENGKPQMVGDKVGAVIITPAGRDFLDTYTSVVNKDTKIPGQGVPGEDLPPGGIWPLQISSHDAMLPWIYRQMQGNMDGGASPRSEIQVITASSISTVEPEDFRNILTIGTDATLTLDNGQVVNQYATPLVVATADKK